MMQTLNQTASWFSMPKAGTEATKTTKRKKSFLSLTSATKVELRITVRGLTFKKNEYFLANSHYVVFLAGKSGLKKTKKTKGSKVYEDKTELMRSRVSINDTIRMTSTLYQDDPCADKFNGKDRHLVIRQVSKLPQVDTVYKDIGIAVVHLEDLILRGGTRGEPFDMRVIATVDGEESDTDIDIDMNLLECMVDMTVECKVLNSSRSDPPIKHGKNLRWWLPSFIHSQDSITDGTGSWSDHEREIHRGSSETQEQRSPGSDDASDHLNIIVDKVHFKDNGESIAIHASYDDKEEFEKNLQFYSNSPHSSPHNSPSISPRGSPEEKFSRHKNRTPTASPFNRTGSPSKLLPRHRDKGEGEILSHFQLRSGSPEFCSFDFKTPIPDADEIYSLFSHKSQKIDEMDKTGVSEPSGSYTRASAHSRWPHGSQEVAHDGSPLEEHIQEQVLLGMVQLQEHANLLREQEEMFQQERQRLKEERRKLRHQRRQQHEQQEQGLGSSSGDCSPIRSKSKHSRSPNRSPRKDKGAKGDDRDVDRNRDSDINSSAQSSVETGYKQAGEDPGGRGRSHIEPTTNPLPAMRDSPFAQSSMSSSLSPSLLPSKNDVSSSHYQPPLPSQDSAKSSLLNSLKEGSSKLTSKRSSGNSGNTATMQHSSTQADSRRPVSDAHSFRPVSLNTINTHYTANTQNTINTLNTFNTFNGSRKSGSNQAHTMGPLSPTTTGQAPSVFSLKQPSMVSSQTNGLAGTGSNYGPWSLSGQSSITSLTVTDYGASHSTAEVSSKNTDSKVCTNNLQDGRCSFTSFDHDLAAPSLYQDISFPPCTPSPALSPSLGRSENIGNTEAFENQHNQLVQAYLIELNEHIKAITIEKMELQKELTVKEHQIISLHDESTFYKEKADKQAETIRSLQNTVRALQALQVQSDRERDEQATLMSQILNGDSESETTSLCKTGML